MRSAPVTLRGARPEDVPAIAGLIRDLAAYERAPRECRADETLLRDHLFGERPYAETIVAEREGELGGFALFFHNYSTWLTRPGLYLEDLYVKPELRGLGIGKALLVRLAEIAVARGCGRMEWSVLTWNEPAIGFYRSLGAVPMDEWRIYRLSGEALRALGRGGA
ncbi:MAG TPA: GNAT family N-acetyltransferase [Thermoanaerobaculia bacterium]|nr:GNAT family N-acetyltransferase [Thermoanaerobaculia bacterium]